MIGEVDAAPAPTSPPPQRPTRRLFRATAPRLVAGFTAAGVLVTVGLAVAIALVARHQATVVATDQVAQIATATAHGVVEPQLSDGLLTGDPAAIRAVDDAVRRAVLGHSLFQVKIWDDAGRIVYSDHPDEIGDRHSLDAAERRALAGLDQEAGTTEDATGTVLEVYTGVRTPGGTPLLYEAYFRYDAVAEAGWDAWRTFAPLSVGALLLLELVQIPLAVVLARKLQRRERQRERLLRHAVEASTAERRRIAQDLHDGVVQELTGITYGLDATRLRGGPEAGVATESATRLRESIGSLRTLLVDIYPPNLAEEGLGPALHELAAGLRRRRPTVAVHLDDVDEVGPAEAALLYRATQETVRNIVSHAGAEHVQLTLTTVPDGWRLDVADDGRGFDPNEAAARRAAGHLGLRSITDLVEDAGGSVDIRSAPGAGTTVTVRLPPT
ncbi:sensor histidine kinase [Actinomycetospora termitidis]|uniref:Oxygen sensor histidine kinase NreB n=1 Tax=Actinomycetospora termitidis TaxID=3053470 RepID=A0ABT7MHM7_9PSEU|nr:sensor histidine kinase [Actinomycetospora sp. Odt1-22]MDL5159689.1 sensor histidine kinase [Actinomycetospora sp. Odt1-22]